MKIDSMMRDPGPEVYYDPDFRALLEAHIPYLRVSEATRTMAVDLSKTAVYRGDFYGFLNAVGIPAYFHWIIMRLNDMSSPTEFDEKKTFLLVPEDRIIGIIEQQWRTTGSIS